jgi:ArsR family transcriptional regulator
MNDLTAEFAELHARICKGLADPKRLLILNALRDSELSVTELCEALELPQANISQHLGVLRDRGLVTSRRDGQWVFYSVTSDKIIQALDLLREMLAEQVAMPVVIGQ